MYIYAVNERKSITPWTIHVTTLKCIKQVGGYQHNCVAVRCTKYDGRDVFIQQHTVNIVLN